MEPKGPLYGICVVGPFFGDEIAPNDYAFRFAIPVEERHIQDQIVNRFSIFPI